MMRVYGRWLLCVLCACAFVPLCAQEEADSLSSVGESEACRDTVWQDSLYGRRVHLQVLGGTDTLRIVKPSLVSPVLESLGINFGVWGYDYLMGRNWAKITSSTVSTNLGHDFVLDCDSYSGNHFSHPYHGSMFYNAARYHGHSYYTAALYPLIGSAVWEYFCETNLPSYNDFLSTGIGGSAIGEVTHRTSDLVFDDTKRGVSRVVREIVGSALNPARGIHRLLSGEMWRVSPSRGKMETPQPFSLDVGVGNRHIHETRHRKRTRDVVFVDFNLVYGDPFRERAVAKPFDFFTVHAQLNASPGNPTFGDVDIRGRILSHTIEGTKGWKLNVGLYQNYRYVDNYGSKHEQRAGDFALFCETASFGLGCYAAKSGRRWAFSDDVAVNGVIFGAYANDTYAARRYNYGSGFSLRNNMRLSLGRRVAVGEEFYMARLFTPKGPKDPTTQSGDYDWGEKGQVTLMQTRFYLHVNMGKNVKASASMGFFYRRANYAYSPDVHAHSNEASLAIIYSI